MEIKRTKIGKKVVWPFTIPSGIVTTEVSCLKKLAREIPMLGILTTKSIGAKERVMPTSQNKGRDDIEYGCREPILTQYAPGCWMNAVKLTNPGAKKAFEQFSSTGFPPDEYFLASMFGKDIEEFVFVAKTLESLVDGFELNFSCPHAKGYGMSIGQDLELSAAIVRAVRQEVRKEVDIWVKQSPNLANQGEAAKNVLNAGAYGLVLINTVGPGYFEVDGHAVLTNEVGGLSGAGILPIGLKCVRDVRKAVGDNVPIIGMGGIATARDVEAYNSAGANYFGVGSALAGMSDDEIKVYFLSLTYDLSSGENTASLLLKKVDTCYRKVRVKDRIDAACDFKIVRTNRAIEAEPGQFVFAWIPGVGEKPFSVMDDNPLTLGVLTRGDFTEKFNALKEGDEFYFRGPYGKKVDVKNGESIVLVGGGCGIAGLYLLAKKAKTSRLVTLLGAKDKFHLPYVDKFRKYGEVYIATEDGSFGIKGNVLDLFKETEIRSGTKFYNCGPRAMVDAVLPLELAISSPDIVYSSVDYMTSCGVGICGKCVDNRGRRTCVEGVFMMAN